MNIEFTLNTVLAAAGAITVLGGAVATIQRITASFRRKRASYRQDIIDHAKEEMDMVKQVLEAKIEKLEAELESQKETVSKDLGHLREIYTGEIKVLGERIEDIRNQLNSQHTQLVELLTRLVDNK